MKNPHLSNPCHQFQSSLLRRLNEGTLAFLDHEDQAHVVSCSACRAMLEEEQALESWMNADQIPPLSAASTERLVKRLHARLDAAVWALLDLDLVPSPPRGLGRRVATQLREEALGLELVPTQGVGVGRRNWLRMGLAAAAAALVFVFAPWKTDPTDMPVFSKRELAELPEADVELLEWLDVLEQWETLQDLEPIEADMLATLDAGDLFLLDLGEAN